MSITSVIPILCVWFFSSFFALCAVSEAAPKSEVAIFQYKGAIGDLGSAKFDMFRGIVEEKVDNLKRELFQFDLHGKTSGKDLFVSYHAQDNFTRNANIKRWLQKQASVLCLLRGTIVSDDNVTYTVRSSFHLGTLKEYFPHDVIKIELPIKSSELSNTEDSHSLVILYALAMDAKRGGEDRDDVQLFLRAALDKLADIERRSGKLKGDLGSLEQAIIQASQDLQEGDNGS